MLSALLIVILRVILFPHFTISIRLLISFVICSFFLGLLVFSLVMIIMIIPKGVLRDVLGCVFTIIFIAVIGLLSHTRIHLLKRALYYDLWIVVFSLIPMMILIFLVKALDRFLEGG